MALRRTSAIAILVALLAMPGVVLADSPPPPYPPYPPPSRTRPLPPRRAYPPPPVVEPPPPLSPVTRAIYAPFYAAGLIVRYGFYYLLVAPFEVFGRTVAYGVNGGVEPPPPAPPPRHEESRQ
jgi:hypothetical protein